MNDATNTAADLARYAVYTTDRNGSPCRLDWVGEAADEDDAIRQCYDDLAPGEDAEAGSHVAFEVTDPTITAGAVTVDGDQREVAITMVVGPETFRGTATLMQRLDGVWDAVGDSVDMWIDRELIKAADLAEELDEGTRDIVLSEVVATARGAIRRAESRAQFELHRVNQGPRGETSTDLLDAYPTEDDAADAARRLLRSDPEVWLSIVHIDGDGLADPVVARVEP